MKELNEAIKGKFREVLESGQVKGHLEGPKKNILVCDTLNDWVRAGNEMMDAGFDITSPGGYGGSSPVDRSNTWNKIWKHGTLCASVIEKKIFIFRLLITEADYCDVVHEKKS
jgi:hypothetical protein